MENTSSIKKPVESILISQPQPERSPYFQIEEKYDLKIDFRQFIQVEPVSAKEIRREKIKIDDYNCVIFSSKNSIDHFFRVCEEFRIKMSQDTRYFCLSEAIANYLQKFIVYRKRKVFVGQRFIADLKVPLNKFKEGNKFILPCSNLGSKVNYNYLKDNEFDFMDVKMFETVASDLSDLENIFYDVLVFFSPLGIQSLYENFPNFTQKDTRIAVWGKTTAKAVLDHDLRIDIMAPTDDVPSMTMALKKYLQESNPL